MAAEEKQPPELSGEGGDALDELPPQPPKRKLFAGEDEFVAEVSRREIAEELEGEAAVHFAAGRWNESASEWLKAAHNW